MSYTLSIEDANGNVYNFDGSFMIESEAFSLDNNINEIAFYPGATNTSDNFPKSRVINIKGSLYEDTEALFETSYSSFKQAILKGGKLRKVGDIVDRYIEVIFSNCDPGFSEGQRLRKDIFVNFIALFPFWVDETQTDDINIVTGDTTINVDTTGTEFLLYPVITIEADQSADLPGILLKNNNDGASTIIFNNSLFVSGDVLEIDCSTGVVRRNSNIEMEYFDGSFFRLQVGNNEIEYEGNACTITLSYRKVYL